MKNKLSCKFLEFLGKKRIYLKELVKEFKYNFEPKKIIFKIYNELKLQE